MCIRDSGKTLKSLKKASNEFQNEIDQVMNEEDKDGSPKSIESNQTNENNQEKIDSENKNFLNKENSNN